MGAFWDAWDKQDQLRNQAAQSQIQQATGLAGLMQQVQQQQQMQAVRGLLADPNVPDDQKIPALVKLGPAGIDAANKIAVVQQHQAQTGLLGRRNVVDTKLQDPEIWKDPAKLAPLAGQAILSGHPGGASILNYANSLREQKALEDYINRRNGVPPATPQAVPQSMPPGASADPMPPRVMSESAAKTAMGMPPSGPMGPLPADPYTPGPTAQDIAVAKAKLADPNTKPAERAAYQDLLSTVNQPAEQPVQPPVSQPGTIPLAGGETQKPASAYTQSELENMALSPSKPVRELGKRLLAEKIALNKLNQASELAANRAAEARLGKEPPAPALTEIANPLKPDEVLKVDARKFDEKKFIESKGADRTGVVGTGIKATEAGKADAKLERERPAAQQRLELGIQGLDRLESSARNLRLNKGLDAITGGFAGINARTLNITDDARNAQAELDALKSQVFASALQTMRDMSKTGGAVGNVSNREGDKLESMLGSLDQKQSPEAFKEKLKGIEKQIQQSKTIIQKAFDDQFLTPKSNGTWSVVR